VAITIHTVPETEANGKVCLVPLSSIVMNPASAVHSKYPCRFNFYEYPKDPSRRLLDVRPTDVSGAAPMLEVRAGGDVCFREFCTCGRLFRIDPKVLNIPRDWEPSLKEDEDPRNLTLDSWRNGHQVSLTFHRPGPLVDGGEKQLWRPAPALMNGYMRWDTNKSKPSTGEWTVDWAPEDGVTVRLDDQPTDATAYAPFVDMFLDWKSVEALQKAVYNHQHLYPVLLKMAGEKEGYNMASDEAEASISLNLLDALSLGNLCQQHSLAPKPHNLMKEELYGIIEGPASRKKFKESSNHPYLTQKTSLELNISLSSMIPEPRDYKGRAEPRSPKKKGKGKDNEAVGEEIDSVDKEPLPEPAKGRKVVAGFDVEGYLGKEVLANLSPALSALTEEHRLRPEKLVKPLRWLAAYLHAHNPKKTATPPNGQHGAGMEREVTVEEGELDHATALIKASCEDNPAHVDFWMGIGKQCADMDAKDTRPNYRGWTGLHYAVLNNNAALSRTLLEAGADVDAADDYGITPMMIAAYMGLIDVAAVLLDFTVRLDPSSYNDKAPMNPACGSNGIKTDLKFGHSALHWALEKYAEEGQDWSCYKADLGEIAEQRVKHKAEIAQVILEHGGDADQFSATGLSPYHMACMLPGFTVVAEQLKLYGRFINSEEFPAPELLCLAATEGNVPMLSFLRQQKINVDERDALDRTALYCAADAGWHETVMWLGEYPKKADLAARCTEAKRLPLHAAVANGHLQCVKVLANLGADMEAEEGAGCTPLHTGAQCGHGDVVDHLVSMGVNVNAKDASGATPYILASAEGHLSLCKALCNAGADHALPDAAGKLGIHTAANRGQLELVEFALNKGSNVDVADGAGRTAMMMAAKSGHFEVVKYLEGQNAQMNSQDLSMQRALHFAAEAAHLEIVQFLCESGAEPDAVDDAGITALYLACKHNHLAIVECLINNGATYDIQVTEKEVPDAPPAPEPTVTEGAPDEAKEGGAEEEGAEAEEAEEEEEVVTAAEIIGRTALHVAADGLHVKVVELLCKGGAEVDIDADDGLTPLLTAVMSKAEAPESDIIKIVNHLVEAGASVTVTDAEGRSVLQNALMLGRRDLAAQLRKLVTLSKQVG